MQNFLAIILFATSIWGFLGYVEPKYRDILKLQVERTKYIDALANAREVDILRNKLMAEYREVTEQDLARISKMIPDGVDNVRLIIDIDSIARKHGMIVSQIAVGNIGVENDKKEPLGPADKYDRLGLSFNVAGQYDNIKGFVKDLEKSLRVVDLESLDISYKENDNKSISSLTASIKLVTYWLKK